MSFALTNQGDFGPGQWEQHQAVQGHGKRKDLPFVILVIGSPPREVLSRALLSVSSLLPFPNTSVYASASYSRAYLINLAFFC